MASSEENHLQEVVIEAQVSESHLSETTAMKIDDAPGSGTEGSHPFLIVNGVDIFDLHHPVINIGRSRDNHLVIDDPRVSRNHAQIRVSQSNYHIFDLESTGGTFVNHKRISKSILHPGDIISLAGVTIVYGNENQPSIGETHKIQVFPEKREDNHG